MDNPIDKFNIWWQQAHVDSPLKQKNAICISTIDADGYPSGRFVDLKSVSNAGFVFCSSLDSAKGQQMLHNPKCAITIWWDHVGYQVRIIGNSEKIPALAAQQYWQTRSREAQLTTSAFKQSAPLASEHLLISQLQNKRKEYAEKSIDKPKNWGGYVVKPVSIEFLTFKESRLHLREFYQYTGNRWVKQLLQP